MPVEATHGPDGKQDGARVQIVVRPNQSLSWSGNKLFFGAIAGVSLSVAGVLTFLGFWPVLPFAGLELAALGWALYRCARRAQWREVIRIDGDRVEVIAGRVEPERRWSANRHWTRVAVEPPRFRGHPTRLLLRSAGRAVELGAFLTEEERQRLARLLREALPAAP
jgi:uncharacterized membrane protein